ncbi:MAG: agmatinase [Chloroflexi bacterium]|nr:agmatinase [Chloroflexota bacterium]
MSAARASALAFRPPVTPFTDSLPPLDAQRQTNDVVGALFGAALDRTTSFRSGTSEGPNSIRALSRSLESYSPTLDRDLQDFSLIDLGDLPLQGTMDEALAEIADAMEHAASPGRLGIMIGGEHTVSLGGFRGIKRVYPDALLLQLDAHLDIRDQYEGERITHASWVYHAGQEFGFEDIVQLGLRSGAREEWPRSRGWTGWSSPELALPPHVRHRLAGRPVYLTIDIDVLDPAFAPGTGCPEPGGVTFRELASFLYSLAGLRVVGLDVVEVSPSLDPAGITAVAAAKLIREAALLFGAEGGRR